MSANGRSRSGCSPGPSCFARAAACLCANFHAESGGRHLTVSRRSARRYVVILNSDARAESLVVSGRSAPGALKKAERLAAARINQLRAEFTQLFG